MQWVIHGFSEEREVYMKRFAVILAAAVITVTPVYAVEHETFSTFAEVFGAHDIVDSEADRIENYSRFYQDGCVITFEEENGEIVYALITGEGDPFLAYCYAIMFQFDPDSKHAASNGGQLLGCYLMAHESTEKQYGCTVTGSYFILRKEKEGYTFSIKK